MLVPFCGSPFGMIRGSRDKCAWRPVRCSTLGRHERTDSRWRGRRPLGPRTRQRGRARAGCERRPAARSRHRARRHRSGLADLRPAQERADRRGRHALVPPRAAGHDPAGGARCARRRAQRRSRRARDSRPEPVAGRPRRSARLCSHRSGQGRGRLPPRERRPARAQPARPAVVHAGGRDRVARPLRDRPHGARGGRRGTLEHRASRLRCWPCIATRQSRSCTRARATCRR
jgi:hypothetical protein